MIDVKYLSEDPVRIDKWLWAARFFKTRALAKTAIETGKVKVNGQKSKASRLLKAGELVTVKIGFDEKVVQVLKLSQTRRPAAEALGLYEETQQSQEVRLERQAQRKQQTLASWLLSDGKPDKKDRRKIRQFKETQLHS